MTSVLTLPHSRPQPDPTPAPESHTAPPSQHRPCQSGLRCLHQPPPPNRAYGCPRPRGLWRSRGGSSVARSSEPVVLRDNPSFAELVPVLSLWAVGRDD